MFNFMKNVFKCIGREEKFVKPEFMINFDGFIYFPSKKIFRWVLVALTFQPMSFHFYTYYYSARFLHDGCYCDAILFRSLLQKIYKDNIFIHMLINFFLDIDNFFYTFCLIHLKIVFKPFYIILILWANHCNSIYVNGLFYKNV